MLFYIKYTSNTMTTVVQMNGYLILLLGLVAFIQVNSKGLGACPKFDMFTACVIDFKFHCAVQMQCPLGYRCCPHGCNKRCAAVTVDGKHPGSCGAAYGKRGKTCKVDSSCEGHEKCCYGKCREVRKQIVKVLYPIKITVLVVEMNVYLLLGLVAYIKVNCQDLGTCPTFDIITTCVIDFAFHCNDQDQCPYGYRCCPYGCNKRCVAVTVNGKHLGSCQSVIGGDGNTCTEDRSCEGHEKCCNGRCQTVRQQIVRVLFPVVN